MLGCEAHAADQIGQARFRHIDGRACLLDGSMQDKKAVNTSASTSDMRSMCMAEQEEWGGGWGGVGGWGEGESGRSGAVYL